MRVTPYDVPSGGKDAGNNNLIINFQNDSRRVFDLHPCGVHTSDSCVLSLHSLRADDGNVREVSGAIVEARRVAG